MNWDELIDEQALAELLPPDDRHYAQPVKEGLTVFLSALSPERQGGVLAEQWALPPSATVAVRLGTLARSCPVLQKLGQTLAREPKLELELRRELQQLESQPPTIDLPTIEKTLTKELGSLARRGVRLEPPALAEASVAVVIPFVQAGTEPGEPSRDGVFKLLKPGVESRLEEELNLLERVGEHLDERCDALQIPHLDYQDSFQQVRQKLLSELDLEHEQQLLGEAGEFYAGEPEIQIPALLEHCSPRVTAMEHVHGGKITDFQFNGSGERERLAALLTRALISRPILADRKISLFHGDPHAGNLFRTFDGRLAILDWSLAGRLPEAERVAVNQIMLAAITLRGEKICAELESLARRKQVDRSALKQVVASWLRRIRRGQFPGLRWLVGLLDEATQAARLRVAPDLMLFRKSLLIIDGVLSELGATALHNDRVLMVDFLQQFGGEWPRRWAAVPTSRDFGTRLSNADLTEMMCSLPWTAVRYWLDENGDAARLLAQAAQKHL